MKKLLSLLLAGALTVGLLTGCSKKEEKPDASSSKPVAVEPMDLTKVKDIYKTTAGLNGDTVVATVGEYDITAADLLYWVNYSIESFLYQLAPYGVNEVPWDMETESGSPAENFLKDALETAAFHTLLPHIAEEEGIKMSPEEMEFLEQDIKNAQEELGSAEALEHMMWMQMSSVDMQRRNYAAGGYYLHLSDKFFGEGTEGYPTDADVQAFAQNDLGAYRAKHILISTRDVETNEPLPEDKAAEQKVLADKLAEQIKAADDPAALFDELMKAHSQDPGLATAPEGYDAVKGQMVPEFEEAALALKDGEISGVVESDFGYHIIMRLPLKELAPFREQLVAKRMDDKIQEWLKEYGVETNRNFDKIDVQDFRSKVESLKAGVHAEMAEIAKQQQPEPAVPAPDINTVPDSSAKED